MTESTERLLREVFAEQSAPVQSTTDVFFAARERHRRRRRHQVVAAAMAVAGVVTVVPVTLSAGRSGPAPVAATSSQATPSPLPTVTVPAGATKDVRGSLAGDKALLQAAVQQLVAADRAVRPASIQVSYAEQSGGYRIVVLAGKRPDGSGVSMIASSAPGQPLGGGQWSTSTSQSIDARLGQQYFAPQHVLTRLSIGDRAFGLVLFPDGYRATARHNPSVAADCSLRADQPTVLAVPSFFPIPRDDAPAVEVYAPGKSVPATTRTLRAAGTGSAGPPSRATGEIAAQIRDTMRGKKAVAGELAVFADTFGISTGVDTPPDRFIGVWAGDVPSATGTGYAALFGGVLPSGATELQGMVSDQTGGFAGWLSGCLPAGGLEHTVLSVRLRTANTGLLDDPIVIVAPPSAVTAEVSFGSGAPVRVPLTQGGGFLRHDGTAGTVRALDATGHVVATGRVDRPPLLGIKLPPR